MTVKEIDQLTVVKAKSRTALGNLAAEAASRRINEMLKTQETLNIIFAAAPSQNEFLENLRLMPVIWQRINAFHMDEYIGLPVDASQSFGNFLRNAIFFRVPFKSVNFLNGNAANAEQECERYTRLLSEHPCDIVFMGIGENTHIAFNDPHVANFNDPKMVKVVDLDEKCRAQQVNDGCFTHIEEVPRRALTLTVPALTAAKHIFCMVPGQKKAEAVSHTLNAGISEKYPATVLRLHPSAILFIDEESGAESK